MQRPNEWEDVAALALSCVRVRVCVRAGTHLRQSLLLSNVHVCQLQVQATYEGTHLPVSYWLQLER